MSLTSHRTPATAKPDFYLAPQTANEAQRIIAEACFRIGRLKTALELIASYADAVQEPNGSDFARVARVAREALNLSRGA